MKIQANPIRKRDLNQQEPFEGFLSLYNRVLYQMALILNKGILIQDNLAHQIERVVTSNDKVRFPKRISHEPTLVLLTQAKRNDKQAKQKTTAIKEWTCKDNVFYISLEGVEKTLHTFTFLIL